MTENELRALIRDEVENATGKAVKQIFMALGVDVTDAEDIRNLQADFQHLRAWRESTQTVKRQGLIVLVGLVVAGLAGLVWAAIKAH